MPDSQTERIAFLVGLAAIVALAIALIPAYAHYNSSRAPEAQSTGAQGGEPQQTAYRQPTAPKHAIPASTPVTKPHARALTPVVTATKPKPAVKGLKVSLTASRGDCWLEVRKDGVHGKSVYLGTLVKGKTFEVSAKSLWVRLGAPQNVDVSVNGKAASLPGGTQDVIVTRNGMRAAA
jgi:hypothetical protein